MPKRTRKTKMAPGRSVERLKSTRAQANRRTSRPWSTEEMRILSELHGMNFGSVESVVKALPGRSYAAIEQRWYRVRRDSGQANGGSESACDAISKSCEQQDPARRRHWVTVLGDTSPLGGYSPRVRSWSEADDAVLINGRKDGLRFKEISRLCRRSLLSCHSRWRILRNRSFGPTAQRAERLEWSERDRSLLMKFRSRGMAWTDISQALGRTQMSCRSCFFRTERQQIAEV